jgi:hypothetical protein
MSDERVWQSDDGISIPSAQLTASDVQATTFHVSPDPGGGWRVRQEGIALPSARTVAKEPAISFAQYLARKSGNARVIVHRKDGTVETEHTI